MVPAVRSAAEPLNASLFAAPATTVNVMGLPVPAARSPPEAAIDNGAQLISGHRCRCNDHHSVGRTEAGHGACAGRLRKRHAERTVRPRSDRIPISVLDGRRQSARAAGA